MAKLLLKHEGLTLNTLALDEDEITIGRSPMNTVQLDDAAVSGNHARITRSANAYLEKHFDYFIEDLKSTNGTRVNEQKITRQLLKNGDVILIGVHEFVFDSGEPVQLETTAIYLPDDK